MRPRTGGEQPGDPRRGRLDRLAQKERGEVGQVLGQECRARDPPARDLEPQHEAGFGHRVGGAGGRHHSRSFCSAAITLRRSSGARPVIVFFVPGAKRGGSAR